MIIMALHAPDPHNLRGMNKQAAPVIEVDRPCLSCGYNLRGLRAGIKCPECGMPSKMPEGIDDPLSLMPTRVIAAFIRGCWVASVCVMGLLGVVIAHRFQAWDSKVTMTVLTGIAMLWVGAAYWLTPAFALPQAVIRGFSHASRLRKSARQLQWGWVIAAGSSAAMMTWPTMGNGLAILLSWGRTLGFLGGLTGIVLLSILMERLSDWARDADAEKMFNWATWGLPITTPLLFVEALPMGPRLVLLVVWLALVCTFPWGLISLSGSVTLSILHAMEHEERMKRRDERTQKYHDQVAETVQKMDAPRGKTQGMKPPNGRV